MEKEKMVKMQQIAAQPEVQQKIAEIEKNGEPTTAVILDFWKEQGIDLTETDLDDLVQEVSDAELDDVVGGINVTRKVKVQTHAVQNAELATDPGIESGLRLMEQCKSILGFDVSVIRRRKRLANEPIL